MGRGELTGRRRRDGAYSHAQDHLVMRTDLRGSGFFVSLLFTALSTFAFAIAFALLGIFSRPLDMVRTTEMKPVA